MLTVHVLNVGHGDSIVLECETDGAKSFGVIDSNAKASDEPRALEKLQELGAEELSFIALTHPHADHYGGLERVVDRYAGRIGAIFTFPIEKSADRLRKLAARYEAAARSSDSERVFSRAVQFLSFLKFAKDNSDIWEAPTGLLGVMGVHGFIDVSIKQVLPPSRVKGKYFSEIDSGKLNIEDSAENDLSLAMLLEYKGKSILLGADGTKANWLFQAARPGSNSSFNAEIVKLPHHGSEHDCASQVLDGIFSRTDSERIALISANGKSHPSASVLKYLLENGIKPYCTNLSKHCGTPVAKLVSVAGVEPSLARFVGSVVASEDRSSNTPCQGDLAVTINDDGSIVVRRQYENLCPYRREYPEIQ